MTAFRNLYKSNLIRHRSNLVLLLSMLLMIGSNHIIQKAYQGKSKKIYMFVSAWTTTVPNNWSYSTRIIRRQRSRSGSSTISTFSNKNWLLPISRQQHQPQSSSSSLLFVSTTTTIDDEKINKDNQLINLHTIPKDELEQLIKVWGHPKYRANQIWTWVHDKNIKTIDDMNNIPKTLRNELKQYTKPLQETSSNTSDSNDSESLQLEYELVSKDGTRKRIYKLYDGQLIESVLMPYDDGRYTACISSQAGCAQGCVFCATGQMGFSRQLTTNEIVEQVQRFASELENGLYDDDDDDDDDSNNNNNKKKKNQKSLKKKKKKKRLSNVVFMGMGEPLANYKNVKNAVTTIQSKIGIGYRKITISTVGIVKGIEKLMIDLPQVRLAISLHCATDDERSELLPANKYNGGITTLLTTISNYIKQTGRRVTFEWALISGENDTPQVAHTLGKLLTNNNNNNNKRRRNNNNNNSNSNNNNNNIQLRRDMMHINVIPLNPTGGYMGGPSNRKRVNAFTSILQDEYGIACTPRVRRGIDINAGCGQLKAEVEKKNKQQQQEQVKQDDNNNNNNNDILPLSSFIPDQPSSVSVGVYNDDDIDDDDDDEIVDDSNDNYHNNVNFNVESSFDLDDSTISFDYDYDNNNNNESDDYDDNWDDYVYNSKEEQQEEALRLISLVKGTVLTSDNTIIHTNDEYQKQQDKQKEEEEQQQIQMKHHQQQQQQQTKNNKNKNTKKTP